MISSKDLRISENTPTSWSCWVIRFKLITLADIQNDSDLKRAFSEQDLLSFDSGCVSSCYPNLSQDAKNFTALFGAPCRLRGCKNWPTPFPGWMSYKATKPGLAVCHILACFIVLLFIRAAFYVLLVFVAMCSVFWLFWLSYQYLPSDWLERLLFCVSLGSWVISLTVLGASSSITNLNEPPRALATSTIMWVRS